MRAFIIFHIAKPGVMEAPVCFSSELHNCVHLSTLSHILDRLSLQARCLHGPQVAAKVSMLHTWIHEVQREQGNVY